MPLERIRELKDLPYLMRKKPHLQQRGRILSTKPVRINPEGKKISDYKLCMMLIQELKELHCLSCRTELFAKMITKTNAETEIQITRHRIANNM